MSAYDAIATSLREAILADWAAAGRDPDGVGAQVTLDTNTVLVEARTAALLTPLLGPLGPGALDGLDVLDLGCGYGAMSLLLASLGARVIGIDPHRERLALAQGVAARHGLDARFSVGRTEALLLADERHDLAIVNNSLCYIVEPAARAAALGEALRVLRRGGRIVVRDPNRIHPRDQFTGLPFLHQLPPAAAGRVARGLRRPRSDVRLHGAGGLRRELRRAGFAGDAQLPAGPGRRARVLRGFTGYVHVTALRPVT